MLLKPQRTWRKEITLWALCLTIAFLLGWPLIAQAAIESQANAPFPEKIAIALHSLRKVGLVKGLETRVLGRAYLDLGELATANSVGEADNVRWSLIRRTAAAAEVFTPGSGVDWRQLRTLSQEGRILLPAGFAWSFNETFKEGPGYKEAGGILAGGHCALATAKYLLGAR